MIWLPRIHHLASLAPLYRTIWFSGLYVEITQRFTVAKKSLMLVAVSYIRLMNTSVFEISLINCYQSLRCRILDWSIPDVLTVHCKLLLRLARLFLGRGAYRWESIGLWCALLVEPRFPSMMCSKFSGSCGQLSSRPCRKSGPLNQRSTSGVLIWHFMLRSQSRIFLPNISITVLVSV